jgi:hypothetical protein
MAPYEEPLDPKLAPGESVVETNVENSMAIGKGEGRPAPWSAGTDATSPGHWRTSLGVVVAIVVALLLALPVLWGLVELFTLIGVVGPWIWAWAVSLVAILVLTVVIGYRIARQGM